MWEQSLKDLIKAHKLDLSDVEDVIHECVKSVEGFCEIKFEEDGHYTPIERRAVVSALAAAWAVITRPYDSKQLGDFFLKIGGWKLGALPDGMAEALAHRDFEANSYTPQNRKLFDNLRQYMSVIQSAGYYSHPNLKGCCILRLFQRAPKGHDSNREDMFWAFASKTFWNPWASFMTSQALAGQTLLSEANRYARQRNSSTLYSENYTPTQSDSYADARGRASSGGRDSIGFDFNGSADGNRLENDSFPAFFKATNHVRLL